MPLSKRTGNMYDWVTHTWSCLQGQCPHECSYCYVAKGRWTRDNPAYKGEPRLEPNFDKVKLGRDRTIFVAHTSDLFAVGVPRDVVTAILGKCSEYPCNDYVIQTKNPLAVDWERLPRKYFMGTTIETDNDLITCLQSKAPAPAWRARGLRNIKDQGGPIGTFITIEPIMKFDHKTMVDLIRMAEPSWVNIGADSKGCNLPEPTWNEVQDLIHSIKDLGIEIREKSNLDRLRRAA